MSRTLASGLSPTTVRRLRDAGLEVVLLADGAAPGVVAAVAEQEDVDAIAVGDPEHGAEVAARVEDAVVFWVT